MLAFSPLLLLLIILLFVSFSFCFPLFCSRNRASVAVVAADFLTIGLPRNLEAVPQWRSGREASQAFDFWSTTHNLEASPHEGEFARETPWCRSGVWARGKSRF